MMDEKQLAEVIKFVKANPEAFKEAEKWYKEADFLSKKDAWDESVVFNDWDKILFLVNNFFSEDYEEACFMLYLGIIYTNDIHPTDKIIEVALKKGEKAVKAEKTTLDIKPPLGEIATLIYEKLKTLPEHKAMNLPQIAQWLNDKHEINIDENTIRTNHIPQLQPYGLYHKKRIGYCLRQQ